MRAWIAPVAVLGTIAVAQAADFDKAKFAALTPGMTKDQVIASVGEPYSREAAGHAFVYRFTGVDPATGADKIVVVTVFFFGADSTMTNVEYYSN